MTIALNMHYKNKKITAAYTVGTTVYFAVKDSLWSHTISGGAHALLAKFKDDISAVASDATYVYVAVGNEIWRYTIANGTLVVSGLLGEQVTALATYNNIWYAGTISGKWITGP